MWHKETLHFDPAQYFQLLCRDIAAARHSVSVEVYILEKDRCGQQLLAALRAAASQGVQVRLLIDGVGSADWTRSELSDMQRTGIDARVHNPPPRPIGWFYDSWLSQIRWLPHSLTRLNKRTHRKVVVIDKTRAWVGSQNYGERFLSWRESNCTVHGPQVEALHLSLERVWQQGAAANRPPPAHRSYRLSATANVRDIRTNTTMISRHRHRQELLQRIRSAKRRVWLTTAYFVPTTRLMLALLKAVQNGAEVALIVPAQSDHMSLRWLSQIYFKTLLRYGVKVHEYRPCMMHAKSLIADDWVTLGSTNMNHRSFYHDFEIDIVLHRPESHQALCKQFLLDRQQCSTITSSGLEMMPWPTKFAARVAHLIRNWL